MNILILSWRGPGHPSAGGAEQSTWQHAKGWVKAGHHVTLLTAVFVSCQPREVQGGVNILRIGDQFIGVRCAAFFWYWFGKHSSFDLVVDEFHGIPFFTPVWAFKSKILGFIHEVAQPVWHLNTWPKPFNLIPAIIGKIGEPLVFKLLYRQIPFMTVSESTKKDLVNFGVKKVTVVHNGVTLPKKLPKAAKEKTFTVIYLSALAKDKGIEDAIRAFELFHRRFPRSKFWIVGKGDYNYVSYLKSQCKSGKFLGYVSENKKFELLARAHVLLNPSIHEGWGLVNIEANSVRIPVVAYNVPGCRDSIKNNITGRLCPQFGISCLAESINKLMTNNPLYKRLSTNAWSWSNQFSWTNATNQSLKLISSITS